MNWINIKEAHPADNQKVLVTDGRGMAVSEYYKSNDPDISDFSGDEWEWDLWKDDITHWAELPELPKVSQQIMVSVTG